MQMNFSAFIDRNRLTDLEDKFTVTRGEGREKYGLGVWDGCVHMLSLKSITNKDLLHGTETSVQYSVIT